MPQVGLDEQEWNQVMNLLAQAPWRDVNALLMKIGAQLRQQSELKESTFKPPKRDGANKQDKEAHHD